MHLARASSARFFAGLLALSFLQAAPPAEAQQLAAAPQKFKAIWEPVNYPGDFTINTVYFANENIGWAAGAARRNKGAVILYTENGGEKWDIQLGDPNSEEAHFEQLYFLDARHGWVSQYGGKILRTADGGKSWTEAGSFPRFQWLTYFTFLTPQQGRAIGGSANDSKIFSTQDGGRNWKQDFPCAAQVQIDGLTKRLSCSFFDMQFPTANVGYVVGGRYNGGFSVIAKTEDGGVTWRNIFSSTDIDSIETVFFTDEKRGVVRSRDHKIFVTEDGGQSWRGIPSSTRGKIRFADPSVGWSCWGVGCAVTSDGGQTWTSRDLRLPAVVKTFSAPRRDRVYLVGEHGMVYRYRIVPANHTAKGILDAPPVRGYGAELNAPINDLQAKVRALQAKAASGQGDSLLKEAGFAQSVALLETDAGALSQQAPGFAARYRNLNLLHVGATMGEDLQARVATVNQSVLALKGASDLKSAAAALQEIAARLDETSGVLASGFLHLAAADGAATTAGAVRNMAGAPSSGAEPPAAPPSAPPQAPNAKSGSDAVVDEAAEQVKNVLKRFIRF